MLLVFKKDEEGCSQFWNICEEYVKLSKFDGMVPISVCEYGDGDDASLFWVDSIHSDNETSRRIRMMIKGSRHYYLTKILESGVLPDSHGTIK